ncbi:MAG: CU044_2847 family protein [Prochlorothrix sp.]
MIDRSTRVPVQLDADTKIYIEVVQTGREDVALGSKTFEPVAKTIEAVAKAMLDPIKKAKPTRASLTFGLEIGIEQGSLMAALVRGTGNANLEITLEWEKEDTIEAP